MKYLFPSLVLLIYSCVPITPSDSSHQKQLLTSDLNYENSVGMVQLYPMSPRQNSNLEYPAISTNSAGLKLEFDLLENNSYYLYVRYVHCNADWSISPLADLQFLDVYNEFPIDQYNYSANTRIPYVSYSTALPTPTKSGNYVLAVYKDNDRNNIILTRRFLVYEQRSQIDVTVRSSTSVADMRKNHQIEFDIKYQGMDNVNALRDFKVVLLQNHNWNTIITGLQPTQMRMEQNLLQYRHFNGENNFPGLNEFRFFDLRSIDFRGMNVVNVEKRTEQVTATIGLDKTRGNLAYTELINDLNGGYILENRDPDDSQLQSEYVHVNFELLSEPLTSNIYVTGRWNNWKLDPENMLVYNPSTGSYRGSAMLKQGYYDYMYWISGSNANFYDLEGSHDQTENNYEILFYYRNPFNNYDELIGYRLFSNRN